MTPIQRKCDIQNKVDLQVEIAGASKDAPKHRKFREDMTHMHRKRGLYEEEPPLPWDSGDSTSLETGPTKEKDTQVIWTPRGQKTFVINCICGDHVL